MKSLKGYPPILFVCLIHLTAPAAPITPIVHNITDASLVTLAYDGRRIELKPGDTVDPWTLMAVISDPKAGKSAVLEDFTDKRGRIIIANPGGIVAELPKSLEPSHASARNLYRGHTLDEILNSDTDLLADELLATGRDPSYDDVAACLPPIGAMLNYTFLGTQDSPDKVGFAYGGSTLRFNLATYVRASSRLRSQRAVEDGLVGGWLPVVRFVYPESETVWSELLAYAPMRADNDNHQVQPVWYRVAHVENGRLQWARYFDSYMPFPPRLEHPADAFYEEMLGMKAGWEKALAGAMTIDIPDRRLADLSRHSLVRDMMTRVGDYPKYGVVEKDYGGGDHDGFPDTFNVDTTAMLEWGLPGLAGRYLDNYFGKFVRDDGSLLYRGPETGQYGRMLTVVAQYLDHGGDPEIVLRNRSRIDGVTKLLLSLRRTAQKLPPHHPAYGMIAGWSEADSFYDPDPPRYMQPYFGNSTEAARGFRDLGRAWEKLGRQRGDAALAGWGRSLGREADSLLTDLHTSIERSTLRNFTPVCLPAIAGTAEPFHVAAAHEKRHPLWRGYRSYMEMLFSGNLTRTEVETVVRYRAAHRDTILAIPTCYGYNSHEIAGFLTYGHGYGLLQHDFIREFLLTLYSIEAHQYTRGTWTAPETRRLDPDKPAAPYCTPAQLVVPLFTRWMLAFEDPQSETLWLAKGAPREWLADGRRIAVTDAPTRWGKISYEIESELTRASRILARVVLPPAPFGAAIRLRLRTPAGHRLSSITLDGRPWTGFDADTETIVLPSGLTGRREVVTNYVVPSP